MSPQQQRIAEAFNVRGYYHGMNGGSGIRGLGDDSEGPSGQQIATGAVQISQGAVVAANDNLPVTVRIGGGIMAAGGTMALIPGLQLPGAIVAAVGAITELIGGLFKPDLTKIEASRIVDQLEAQYLKPNRAAWQSLRPDQKTQSVQAAALTLFDHVWNAVLQGCGNPALGTAGQNCITDRQQGACHYTVDGQTPGIPPNCGNWFVWYRDPIANDPNVIPDPVIGNGTGAGSSFVGSVDSTTQQVSQALGISPLAIGAALIGLALFLGAD